MTQWVDAGAGAGADGGVQFGSATLGAAGVPSWAASQGSDVANTWVANGQSCFPGAATTVHAIPSLRPNAHKVFAAWV